MSALFGTLMYEVNSLDTFLYAFS